MSPYNAKAVANTLLEKLQNKKLNANSIKLQKIIYFAHGWHLAICGTNLITENAQASPNGVLISSIHHACKEFGNNHISSAITEFNNETSKWEEPFVASDEFVETLLDKIVEKYGYFSTEQLCNITHSENTPWEQVVKTEQFTKNNLLSIDDDIIKRYFQEYANAQKPGSQQNLLNIKIDDINVNTNDILNTEADKITLEEQTEYAQAAYWSSFKSGDKRWKRIKDYAVLWSSSKQKGIIKLTLADEVEYKIVVKSFKEMDAIANIFRFEKTVYYNVASGALASGWLPLLKEN